jgi:hypothetical protein
MQIRRKSLEFSGSESEALPLDIASQALPRNQLVFGDVYWRRQPMQIVKFKSAEA